MSIGKHLILFVSLWKLLQCTEITPKTTLLLPELPNPTTKIINIPYVLKVMDTINYLKKIESYTLVVTNLLLDARDEDDVSLFRQKMFQSDMLPHILIYNSLSNDITDLHISDILNLNSITIVFAKTSKDNVLNKASDILRNFKLSVVIVVITSIINTNKAIMLMVSRIVNKLAADNIVNSAVIYDNNVFKFELYPSLKLLNMSGREYFLDLKAHHVRDFQGYPIRTPIKNDMPRVFKSPEIANKVHGIAGVLFSNYVRFHNGTLEEYPLNFQLDHPFVNVKDILELIQEKQIEISIHSYSLYDRKEFGGSYPIFGTDWCLMVPVRKEIPRYMYLVRPLQWRVWILVFFSVIYISLVLNTFDWVLRDKGRWRYGRFGKAILNAIAFIVNIPTTFRLASVHWKHITGVYVFLLLLGFVLSNYYTALLSSFMTTTIYADDLNTVDDLIAADIPIMAQNFDAERLFSGFPDSKKLEQILRVVEPEEFNAHRNNFNQSFAYPLASDRWFFFTLQQKFIRPLFRYSDICFSRNLPVSFPMEYDSHLYPSMQNFILNVYAAGLIYYWVARDFDLAVKMGEMQRFQNYVGVGPVTLEKLMVAWLLLAIGLTLSGIAFVVEYYAPRFLTKKTI